MNCFPHSDRVGSLVDPDVINTQRISPQSLTSIVASMDADDVDRFERDLRDFDLTGERSEFLLGILAVAAGKRSKRNQRAVVYDIQPNVIGLAFEAMPQRANAV